MVPKGKALLEGVALEEIRHCEVGFDISFAQTSLSVAVASCCLQDVKLSATAPRLLARYYVSL